MQLRTELDAAYFILYGVDCLDTEYMLSTFTNTGFITENERSTPDDRWTRGSIGEMTLDAYDYLSGLVTIR